MMQGESCEAKQGNNPPAKRKECQRVSKAQGRRRQRQRNHKKAETRH